ncbi:MAG: X-Pro aminopeptidase [Bacteroidetes bacterium 43-93]|nr:aminopeptidase P family protein [Bacteroidota bacterium]OJW96130.1 MAG: X-Pro aminopeptidase [Bacteroidetes bacterium 43-93]
MKYLPIPSKLYTQNRERFIKKMKPNSIAIFPGNPVLPTNGDAIYTYRPNADVVWLSGVVQEKSMVILYPDNPDKNAREVLVLLRPNEHLEKWEGHKLRKDEATAISGIKNIQWLDSIDATLQVMMHHADNVYLNTNENDRLDTTLFRPDLIFVHDFMKRYPVHHYERSAPIMKELRSVKTKEEIAVTQIAVDITHKAFNRVMKFIKPGVWEHEIEAEITHEFLRNRATRHAYDCIIASGDRARVLHYIENNQECKSGELILMDFGAEYGNYCADMTRTIPVNGKFTKRQKEVYNAVLDAHNFAKKILKPGISVVDYTVKVNDFLEQQCLKLGLITKTDIKNQDPENPAYRKYFYHGVSHHLGIDVHDLGTRVTPLKEGMLLTIEPGLYIEEEQMGIRIENNVWLTKTGSIDLFKGIPITTDEIENAMKRSK